MNSLRNPRLAVLLLFTLCAALLAACGGPAAAPTATTGQPAAELKKITIGMGYVPNVQFAPLYVAQQKGYYREFGLDVTFEYGQINDLLAQVASGNIPMAIGAGDEVLVARGQGLNVKMVFMIYQKLPIVVFSKAELGLKTPEDLRGRTLGIPGRYGASFIGMQGMFKAAGLAEGDVDVLDIGWTQAAAVQQGQVDAAIGYATNEPLVLRSQGLDVHTIAIADYFNLVSNGVIVGDKLLTEDPDLVRAFVQATDLGLRDTLADPDAAFEISLNFIPELQGGDRDLQRQVLQSTLPYWESEMTKQHGLGYNDPQAWLLTYQFLRDSGFLSTDLDAESAYTNELLPTP